MRSGVVSPGSDGSHFGSAGHAIPSPCPCCRVQEPTITSLGSAPSRGAHGLVTALRFAFQKDDLVIEDIGEGDAGMA